MTKKDHQKFWWIKIKIFFLKRSNCENCLRSLNIFSEIGEKFETGENASVPQRGWTPLNMCYIMHVVHTPSPSQTHFLRQWRAEAVGCPGPTRFLDALENILYSSRKISDDLFLVVHQNFSFFSHQLSNFTRIRSLDAPSAASCPVTTFFPFFLVIYLHFFKETWLLVCPPGWMPGAVAPFAPLSARHCS